MLSGRSISPPPFARRCRSIWRRSAAIASDPAPPSFANTVEALERAGRALERVGLVFGNLVASLGGEALEAVDTETAPLLAQHGMRVALDPDLFRRVDALHARRGELGLEADQLRLLERLHLGLVRSGAALAPEARARMAAISERLAVLHTRFGQNVLHDERVWHLPLDEANLAGLPDFVREGARAAAEERGLSGYAITLSRSLIEPFLSFSERRDLRQVAHEAWTARGYHPGEHDNRPLAGEILALRAERAALLGYESFAAFRLADSMAGRPPRPARCWSRSGGRHAGARPRSGGACRRRRGRTGSTRPSPRGTGATTPSACVARTTRWTRRR